MIELEPPLFDSRVKLFGCFCRSGTREQAVLLCLPAAIRFQEHTLGGQRSLDYSRELAVSAARALSEVRAFYCAKWGIIRLCELERRDGVVVIKFTKSRKLPRRS